MNHFKKFSTAFDLSIIIVNYNTKRLLFDCIKSIYESKSSLDFEIIVIDNNSDDGSEILVRDGFPEVSLIKNKVNRGFAAANNQGLKMMKGQYGLLLNPDTVVLDNAFSKMVEFMEAHKNIGILGCKILNPDGTLQRAAFPPSTLTTNITSMLNLARLLPGKRGRYFQFHLERLFPPDVLI
jgi:GT2 family glycosyltransferase